jgi:hypothetical protein
MDNVAMKLEALRLAVLVMTQSATAGKGDSKPTPSEVLTEAIRFYEWFKKSE